MMNYILFTSVIASFLVTLFLIPFWIRKARQIGLLWDDMNKIAAKKVAGSGGLIVVFSFIIGILIYVAYKTFYIKNTTFLVEIFASLVVILMLAGVGLIDDLMGWRKGGLSRRSRMIIVALAAIPLMVINAGRHVISLPIIGNIDLGLFYHLILIPLGVVGATTTFNFLAGFNGLEAGQGILLLSALSLVAFLTGSPW